MPGLNAKASEARFLHEANGSGPCPERRSEMDERRWSSSPIIIEMSEPHFIAHPIWYGVHKLECAGEVLIDVKGAAVTPEIARKRTASGRTL